MTWHADGPTLELYERGLLDDPRAYSIELHLMACEGCRDRLGSVTDLGRLARVWSGIEAATTAPEPGTVERLLLAAKVPDHSARLLAATPSLRASWFLGVAVALAFCVVAAHAGPGGIVVFLVLAPLLPLAGVAVAYGPGVDPTYEIGLVAPLSSFRLLLIRAVAVLVTTTALVLVASLALAGLGWAAAAWLLPSLALVTAGLALSSVVSPLRAATAVAMAWLAIVTLGTMSAGPASFFGAGLQTSVLAVAVFSCWLLVARREAFERGEKPWTVWAFGEGRRGSGARAPSMT